MPRAFAVSATIFCTIESGVPRGANSPNHAFASNPAMPDSSNVGRSGKDVERCVPVVAKPLSLPAATIGKTFDMWLIEKVTSPVYRKPQPVVGEGESRKL